ncbi:hypothetical protein OFC53_25475, partial [Escherichia coli]|nr:hypothetical protein [Escherichia coli]
RDATLEGLRGVITGGMGISYGKAAIQGLENTQWVKGTAENKIGDVQHSYGYPIASDTDGIGKTIDQSGEFVVLSTDGVIGTDGSIVYGIDKYKGSCVRYSEATSTDAAKVIVVIPGENQEAKTACDKKSSS